MPVQATIQEALRSFSNPTAADESRLWLERVETLLDWMAHHPSLPEVRWEAGRLLGDYRANGDVIPLAPNRRA